MKYRRKSDTIDAMIWTGGQTSADVIVAWINEQGGQRATYVPAGASEAKPECIWLESVISGAESVVAPSAFYLLDGDGLSEGNPYIAVSPQDAFLATYEPA